MWYRNIWKLPAWLRGCLPAIILWYGELLLYFLLAWKQVQHQRPNIQENYKIGNQSGEHSRVREKGGFFCMITTHFFGPDHFLLFIKIHSTFVTELYHGSFLSLRLSERNFYLLSPKRRSESINWCRNQNCSRSPTLNYSPTSTSLLSEYPEGAKWEWKGNQWTDIHNTWSRHRRQHRIIFPVQMQLAASSLWIRVSLHIPLKTPVVSGIYGWLWKATEHA